MTLLLVLKRVGSDRREVVDVGPEPCPAIMADGIAGVCRRGWQYWIEGDEAAGMHLPPNVVPRDGGEV